MKIISLVKIALGVGGSTVGNPLGGLQQLGAKGKSFMKQNMPTTTNFLKQNATMFKNTNNKIAPYMQMGRTGSMNRPGSIGKMFGMGGNKATMNFNSGDAKGVQRSSNLTGQVNSKNKGGFNSAFSNARKQGLSTFEWNGKKFNTQIKGQGNFKGTTSGQNTSVKTPMNQTGQQMSGLFNKRFGNVKQPIINGNNPTLKKFNLK